jgi:putative transcriptional regulator
MKKRILLFLFIILQITLFHHVFALAKTYLSPENYFQGKFYSSVKNNFLIATERMNDSRFKKSVIAMLEHDEDGAWGLVINKPMGSIPLAFLLDSSISTSDEREKLYGINILIFWGGPVEVKKIFVLHSSEYQSESTKNYGGISISQDYNILFDIAEDRGPEKSLVILGYSGWGSGQLEGEMERDHWILSDLDSDIIFEKESMKKWPKAYENSFIRL